MHCCLKCTLKNLNFYLLFTTILSQWASVVKVIDGKSEGLHFSGHDLFYVSSFVGFHLLPAQGSLVWPGMLEVLQFVE